MIPKISLLCVSLFIALMSVELSESILILGRPRFTAAIRPSRSARASATIGELTNSCGEDPCFSGVFVDPVMIHASPALFDALSQAASDRKMGICGSVCGSLLFARLPVERLVSFFPCSWARFHSLANRSPVTTVSSFVSRWFSKIMVFRAVQRTQQIHGRMDPLIPDGGKQMVFRNAVMACLKSSRVSNLGASWSGMRFQTSLAKSHSKKICIVVSCFLHLTHSDCVWTPLLCRFSPIDRARWMMD